MIPIPDTFSKHGYLFALVKRAAKAAIYSQSKDGKLYAYEVHRIRDKDEVTIKGVSYPKHEILAKDEEWGDWAKTYSLSLTTPGQARNAAEVQLDRWAGVAG